VSSHIILLLLLQLLLYQVFWLTNNKASVSVLDVGQGDAILIQTPEYKNILVDAGPDGKVIDELGKKLGFFDKDIDLFVLTHPHSDHFAGFFDVIQKYNVKRIAMTGVSAEDPLYAEFLSQIKTLGIPVLFPASDKDMQIGRDLFLDFIYPFAGESLIGQQASNANNTSVVIKLTDKNGPLAMFMGDAENNLEREILLSGQDISANILKLGHHGSRTATSDAFLQAVSPETTVISAGKDNQFGHPHAETMEKIKDLDVRQTIDGTVEFNF
jgi:competence protein ComEC